MVSASRGRPLRTLLRVVDLGDFLRSKAGLHRHPSGDRWALKGLPRSDSHCHSLCGVSVREPPSKQLCVQHNSAFPRDNPHRGVPDFTPG
jgi:hypothetical protein